MNASTEELFVHLGLPDPEAIRVHLTSKQFALELDGDAAGHKGGVLTLTIVGENGHEAGGASRFFIMFHPTSAKKPSMTLQWADRLFTPDCIPDLVGGPLHHKFDKPRGDIIINHLLKCSVGNLFAEMHIKCRTCTPAGTVWVRFQQRHHVQTFEFPAQFLQGFLLMVGYTLTVRPPPRAYLYPTEIVDN
jgi:hypothetical protein